MGRIHLLLGLAASLSLLASSIANAQQINPVPGGVYRHIGNSAQSTTQPVVAYLGDHGGSDCTAAGCDSCCDTGCAQPCGTCLPCLECNIGDAWTLSNALCPGSCIEVGGWLQAGYNTASDDLFNSHPDRVNIHQSWLYIEKALDTNSCCWDWGFRGDILYGVDAQDTQAFGNRSGNWDFENGFDHGIYGWALPQAYLEVGRGDFSVKVGHFYTLIGYEVVPAPDNFFFSHAITMYNSEPFTHTGALATYNASDNLTLYGGWTLGWDTGFDQFGSGSSFLGGFSSQLHDYITFTYILTAGDFGARGGDAYSHSVVADFTLTEKLSYVFQSGLLRVGDFGEDNIGINQYLFYTINDCLALGARAEWWKGDNVTGYGPHGGSAEFNGSQSYYETTLGVNVKPHANIVIRPEVRFDWSPGGDYDETIFGIDSYITF